MILHQPRTQTSEEQVTYFSPDLPMNRARPPGYAERLGLRKPMAGSAGALAGGVNSAGSQPLIFQVPVRPFNTTD